MIKDTDMECVVGRETSICIASKALVLRNTKLPCRCEATDDVRLMAACLVDVTFPCVSPVRYLTGMVDKRTLEKYEREAKEKNRETW